MWSHVRATALLFVCGTSVPLDVTRTICMEGVLCSSLSAVDVTRTFQMQGMCCTAEGF